MSDVRDRITPYLNIKKKIIPCTIFTLKIQDNKHKAQKHKKINTMKDK